MGIRAAETDRNTNHSLATKRPNVAERDQGEKQAQMVGHQPGPDPEFPTDQREEQDGEAGQEPPRNLPGTEGVDHELQPIDPCSVKNMLK